MGFLKSRVPLSKWTKIIFFGTNGIWQQLLVTLKKKERKISMSSLNNISLIGKRVGVWYAKQGIIKTNFGYMHKDWISEAFKRNFIAGTDPSQYRLVINYSMQSKTNKRVGRDWDSEQVLTSQLDMVDNPRKPGYKTMRFFKWLE